MSFSSYYLWFLIDKCHFIFDDIKSIIIFTRHDRFGDFVNEFMKNRIEAIMTNNNRGKEQFCMTSLNGKIKRNFGPSILCVCGFGLNGSWKEKASKEISALPERKVCKNVWY
jgi:hypothetical protein